MIQYYSVMTNLLQMSLVRETKKATVETISEYVTKGHIATQQYCFDFITALFFSSLVLHV